MSLTYSIIVNTLVHKGYSLERCFIKNTDSLTTTTTTQAKQKLARNHYFTDFPATDQQVPLMLSPVENDLGHRHRTTA